MKIITISREFGSGGRELGKRLADELSFDYYDREIIEAVAKGKGIDQSYAETIMENSAVKNMPLHFRSSFAGGTALQMTQTKLLLEQKKVIEEIAQMGKDCVIIGRNADILLEKYHPFNIFVCADMQVKIQRCMERAGEDEKLTRKEIERMIQRIDKNRRQTREMITESRWGERSSYHLTVNTTDWDIKDLVPAVAEFAKCWFERKMPD